MSDFVMAVPPRLVVEWEGATNGRLVKEAQSLQMTRPLLVVGKSLRANGTLDKIVEQLRGAKITPVLHESVPPEPDIADVQTAMNAAEGCDGVIAVGGGSVLDVGKAAGALAGTGKTARDYFAGNVPVPDTGGKPIIAAPTTSGTGSEVTWVGVFTDKKSGEGLPRKASIRGGAMMPHVAFLDASLTMTCPPRVTAYSGMDALVQAIEAYTSIGANPLTDALALDAVVRVAQGLNIIWEARENGTENSDAARVGFENVALGSLMAGMALNTSRLGLVHGLAHPIGAITGAPHGLLCGLLMPAVIRFNSQTAPEKYVRVAVALGTGTATGETHPDWAIGDLVRLMERLLVRYNVPTRLREVGLQERDLDFVAREAMPSGSTKANPRPVSEQDARQVAALCL